MALFEQPDVADEKARATQSLSTLKHQLQSQTQMWLAPPGIKPVQLEQNDSTETIRDKAKHSTPWRFSGWMTHRQGLEQCAKWSGVSSTLLYLTLVTYGFYIFFILYFYIAFALYVCVGVYTSQRNELRPLGWQ